MSLEIKGKLIEVFAPVQVSEKMTKRVFVIETGEKYPSPVPFQLLNTRVDLIDPYPIGSLITVSFELQGTKWTKDNKTQYFCNNNVWKVQWQTPPVQQSAPVNQGQYPWETPATAASNEAKGGNALEKDDLPF